MTEVTDVTIASGVPVGGDGTVPTISKLMGGKSISDLVDAISTLTSRIPILGPTTQSGGSPIAIPSDCPTLPVAPVSSGYVSTATFTPAATSHTAGDCNGAAAEFTNIGPSAGIIRIDSASLLIPDGTAKASAWRSYLYNVTPPSATADDGAWDLVSGDRASYLGYIDLGIAVDLGSTQWVETHGIYKRVKLSGTSLFSYLVNLTTQTPANVAHSVTLHASAV